jgi:hypothetical protein
VACPLDQFHGRGSVAELEVWVRSETRARGDDDEILMPSWSRDLDRLSKPASQPGVPRSPRPWQLHSNLLPPTEGRRGQV